MRRAIGIDIGTTTLCGCVLDGDTGELLAVETIPNRAALPAPEPWQSLQDAGVILADALALYERLAAAHGPVACVGLTGQMHGIVYLNAAGRPCSPLATWQDGRGNQPADASGESYAARLGRLSGQALATGYGAVTHYYNCQNGLAPPQAASFCTIYDALAMALAGRAAPLLHASSAASLGLYLPESGTWDAAAIEAAGMDAALFPPVARAAAPIGETAGGAAVLCGVGDNQASFIGSVRDAQNTLLVNMGTGSQISCRTEAPVFIPGTESRPYAENDYLWVGFGLCGGAAYALLEQFFRQVAQGAGAAPGSLYPWMDALSEQALGGLDDPLQIRTAFGGTRQNPALRGSIENLGTQNFTPAHFVAGVLQGTVDELVGQYRAAEPLLAQKPTRLVGSGNGLRKSPVWRGLFERALGMPMRVPRHREEAAFGAALFALAGSGACPTLAAAQRLIRYQGE